MRIVGEAWAAPAGRKYDSPLGEVIVEVLYYVTSS